VQTLQTLVRNLAMILLLATFLEMLLPNKSMRGFVQMVMGLFVISAVLAPITSFLHTPLAMEIPAWASTTNQDLPVIAEGQGVKAGRDAVQEQYRQILVHQIEALALGTKDVAAASVDIQFEEGTGKVTDQPKIMEVNVTLTAAKGEIQPVQPITIGQSPQSPKAQSPKAEEVREKISTFMNLAKEKIFVQES
jgi:stage III sporulation protein AF